MYARILSSSNMLERCVCTSFSSIFYCACAYSFSSKSCLVATKWAEINSDNELPAGIEYTSLRGTAEGVCSEGSKTLLFHEFEQH